MQRHLIAWLLTCALLCCSDPHTGSDDKCAETYTAWYGRCFEELNADSANPGMQATMNEFGEELSAFNDLCTQVLQAHTGGGH